jgi:cytochrome c553
MKKTILFLLFLSSFLFARTPEFIVKTICSNCHGLNMDQKCFGVSEKPYELSSSYIKEALMSYRSGKKSDYSNGETMTEQTSTLSDEEIVALSIYVNSLNKK